MGGTITDVTTASYYNGATLECRISDTHVTTYDVSRTVSRTT